MNTYTLEEVLTRKQIRQFLDLPKRLYKGDPNWVCPPDAEIEKRFDPARNDLLARGEAVRWLLRDASGAVVGRLAAFYNAENAATYEQPTGGCGFFECVDDKAASRALFDAARDWLAARGMEAMDGPINFGDRSDFWGVLVEGFTEPLYLNPYNFPYYKEHFEAYGFQNYFNQYSYLRPLKLGELNPALVEKAERLYDTPGYRFEYAASKKLEDYADDFRTIYNQAWAPFTGVKPIEAAHARKILRKMKPIVDRRLLYFAYFEDRPIGFFIMVPDLNRVIRRFGGRFGTWQQLLMLWDMRVRRRADRIFGVIFGVIPEFQGRGVEGGMIRLFEKTLETENLHYKSLELAWVGDFNPVMMRVVESYVRAVRHKTHTTYRYLFDREKEFTRAPKLRPGKRA